MVSVKLVEAQRYALVQATGCVHYLQFGRWYFEININHLDAFGASMVIGWDVPRHALDWLGTKDLCREVPLPGKSSGPSDKYGFGLESTGMVYLDGVAEYTNHNFGTNDIISCMLDQDMAKVAFWKNGKRLALPGGNVEGWIPVNDPEYQLVPAVNMYTTRIRPNEDLCSVTFNFTGPFKFKPPATFDPYGALS
eukprot:GFYU01015161.1.p1 GENE.GFYU01015161.1~~GFYU01015161.1.p1  ORF type:complete len:228 (-),score=51.48 GFYU01015161.1:194-775(-)